MKIVENTGKSPFMSSTKALLSPRRFSGNSNCPTVLPEDLYQISPKSVRKHRKKGKKFTDDLKDSTTHCTNISQNLWKSFVTNSYAEFHENSTNDLDADTRAQTNRQAWSTQETFFFFCVVKTVSTSGCNGSAPQRKMCTRASIWVCKQHTGLQNT